MSCPFCGKCNCEHLYKSPDDRIREICKEEFKKQFEIKMHWEGGPFNLKTGEFDRAPLTSSEEKIEVTKSSLRNAFNQLPEYKGKITQHVWNECFKILAEELGFK